MVSLKKLNHGVYQHAHQISVCKQFVSCLTLWWMKAKRTKDCRSWFDLIWKEKSGLLAPTVLCQLQRHQLPLLQDRLCVIFRLLCFCTQVLTHNCLIVPDSGYVCPLQDESRVKVTVMEVQPVDHRDYSKRLISNIRRLTRWNWSRSTGCRLDTSSAALRLVSGFLPPGR